MGTTALRGQVVSFHDDPFLQSPGACFSWEPDGLVLLRDGLIEAVGAYAALAPELPPATPIHDYGRAIISAGFVDAHVHFPQLGVIGAPGEQLLEWLERYVFPAEARFADAAHAERVAALFLRELLRNGTTTACVYCSVHPQSVDAFFRESERFNTRMIAGKVLMDRNAPEALRDTARTGHAQSLELIGRWHGRGRQHYAVTPRFAASCSPEQLEAAGDLLGRASGLYVQTHLSENLAEIDWVKRLFPEEGSYLEVYDRFGLVGERTVLGHGIHLAEADFCRCHRSGAALAHCPSSNRFLGSGSFRLFEARNGRRPVNVALGSDVGAGTSLSQLRTLGSAYETTQAVGQGVLDALQGFWLATLGGARALRLDHRIGRVAPGFEADLVVLDPDATDLLQFRTQAGGIEDTLFALMTLGDDRAVRATWVAGACVYDRARAERFAVPAGAA